MKRIIFILTLCLLGGMAAQAQAQPQNKKEKQEVVKLRNGHRVRGKIVTYAPLDSVVIQQDDGTLQTIYWNRIKQITKEDWQPQQTLGSGFTPGKGPQKGYRGFFDVEYYLSIDALSRNHFGFSTAHGYQLRPFLFVGAGAGMKISHKQHFNNKLGKKADFYMFPVFADVRLDMLKSRYSPYLDLRFGYTLGNRAYDVMFNPTIGCRIGLTDKLAMNASVGYSLQSTDLVAYPYSESAIRHLNYKPDYSNLQNNPYHCLSFKLGIEF